MEIMKGFVFGGRWEGDSFKFVIFFQGVYCVYWFRFVNFVQQIFDLDSGFCRKQYIFLSFDEDICIYDIEKDYYLLIIINQY